MDLVYKICRVLEVHNLHRAQQEPNRPNNPHMGTDPTGTDPAAPQAHHATAPEQNSLTAHISPTRVVGDVVGDGHHLAALRALGRAQRHHPRHHAHLVLRGQCRAAEWVWLGLRVAGDG